jgi:predicted kinase
MKTLYLMQGVSGSGKSTIANMILEFCEYNNNIKCEIASTDDLWYDEFGKYHFDASRLGEMHSKNQNYVKSLMQKNIENVIVDNTNMTNKEAKPYLMLAKEFGYIVQVITVSCPLSIAKERNSKRNIDRKVPNSVIDNQYNRFEKIDLDSL